MPGRKKSSRSRRYSWVIRHRSPGKEILGEIDLGKGYAYYERDAYEIADAGWIQTQPTSPIFRIILKHLDLTAAAKRRKHHPLETALALAFKCQELLHMYDLDFQVYNVKTKEEIPVCAL